MRIRLLAAVVTVLGLAAAPAGAATSVEITGATASGGTATVSGTALFDPVTAVDVGGTLTQNAAAPAFEAAGLNLRSASIEPIAGGLRFVWHVSSLPAQVPPEGVRYTWAFAIKGVQYQLQAKRTNLVSITTTEDPQGHALQAAGMRDFFQLRGACQTAYQGAPIAGCFHLAFLAGGFDAANTRVFVDLPFDTQDAIGRDVAPDFVPGAVLEPLETAGSSIAASLQAVASTTNVSQFINDWDPYFVAPTVQLAVGAATANPATAVYSTTATLVGSEFTGSVTGLTASKPTVFVRACVATGCAYSSQRVL